MIRCKHPNEGGEGKERGLEWRNEQRTSPTPTLSTAVWLAGMSWNVQSDASVGLSSNDAMRTAPRDCACWIA